MLEQLVYPEIDGHQWNLNTWTAAHYWHSIRGISHSIAQNAGKRSPDTGAMWIGRL